MVTTAPRHLLDVAGSDNTWPAFSSSCRAAAALEKSRTSRASSTTAVKALWLAVVSCKPSQGESSAPYLHRNSTGVLCILASLNLSIWKKSGLQLGQGTWASLKRVACT